MTRRTILCLIAALSGGGGCERSNGVGVTLRLEAPRESALRLDELEVVVEIDDVSQVAPATDAPIRVELVGVRTGKREVRVSVYTTSYQQGTENVLLLSGSVTREIRKGRNEIAFPSDALLRDPPDDNGDGISNFSAFAFDCDPRQGAPACEWLRVSAGHAHTCGIRTDHKIYCWGDNGSGQAGPAGQGEWIARPESPIDPPSGRWERVDAGHFHTCAIDDSGGLYCWGENYVGQLGVGGTTSSGAPRQVQPELEWRRVSAGAEHTCAITRDNRMYCWGEASSGQLLDTSQAYFETPVSIDGNTDWERVAAGTDHSCGIRSGQVHCWGTNSNYQVNPDAYDEVEPDTPIGVTEATTPEQGCTRVYAGNQYTCARCDDGFVCWGGNWFGQLGIIDELEPRNTNNQLNWWFGTAGAEHACAVDVGGEARCWGSSSYGRLGVATTERVVEPVGLTLPAEFPARGWTRMSAGSNHTCGIAQGQLYCWGSNEHGQTGSDLVAASSMQVPVARQNNAAWVSVSAGSKHTCAANDAGGVYCWGSNADDALGGAPEPERVAPHEVMIAGTATAKVAVGSDHSCVFDGSTIQCWGANSDGQIDRGATDTQSFANAEPLGDYALMAVGAQHTCGVESATSTLECWGQQQYGRLGDGVSTEGTTMVRNIGVRSDWDAISAGRLHTCGLAAGTILCWGGNEHGQADPASAPADADVTTLGGDTWTAVSAATTGFHTCALDVGQDLYCWGYNGNGQLGLGDDLAHGAPEPVAGTWRSVSTGRDHTCAIGSDEKLYCWGDNYWGQLGFERADIPGTDEPTSSVGPDLWALVSAGERHTCGIRSGDLFCWGDNSDGQLGGGEPWLVVPTAVPFAPP